MALKPPSGGAKEADLEKILAQLLAGGSAEEVLEALPTPPPTTPTTPTTTAPTTNVVAPTTTNETNEGGAAADGEKKSAPNDWARFSASGSSKIPVHTPQRGSVLNARIGVLMSRQAPAPPKADADD